MKNVLIFLIGFLGLQLSYLRWGTENVKTEKFIKGQIEARIMDIQEGKLAMSRGTTDTIQEYGERIVNDHEKMMQDLKKLAIQKNVVIPFQLSAQKANALNSLMEKQGPDFDKRFIKMMINDHKRDICCFKSALKFQDLDIKAFAEQYLPLIEKHLEEAQNIQQLMKKASS